MLDGYDSAKKSTTNLGGDFLLNNNNNNSSFNQNANDISSNTNYYNSINQSVEIDSIFKKYQHLLDSNGKEKERDSYNNNQPNVSDFSGRKSQELRKSFIDIGVQTEQHTIEQRAAYTNTGTGVAAYPNEFTGQSSRYSPRNQAGETGSNLPTFANQLGDSKEPTTALFEKTNSNSGLNIGGSGAPGQVSDFYSSIPRGSESQ